MLTTNVNSQDVTCETIVQMASDMYCNACKFCESTSSCYKKLKSVGVSDFTAEYQCKLEEDNTFSDNGKEYQLKHCHTSTFLRNDRVDVFQEMGDFYNNEFNVSCTEEFKNVGSSFKHCDFNNPEEIPIVLKIIIITTVLLFCVLCFIFYITTCYSPGL